jgi:Trk K+ transport system NAD-binding subunit
MRRAVVVVETSPRPEAISASRAGHFQLLTGDASRDETLDLCNVGEAAAVIALTNSDTMNLEIALGARARNKSAHVVMRVQQESFEESVRRHFGFERVFGTAALAAPVFAGLAYGPGMRGLVAIGDAGFAVLEGDREPTFDAQPAREVTVVPLAVWRDGRAVLIDDFAAVRPGEIRLALGHAQLGTPV